MNKSLLFLILFTFANIVFGQEKSIGQADLIGCWKYYPEEGKDYPDITVYRPCNYESLPQIGLRYRFKMELMENGKCRFLKIGANDVHLMHDAKWTFDSKSKILTIMTGSVIKEMKLVSVENDLLGASKN